MAGDERLHGNLTRVNRQVNLIGINLNNTTENEEIDFLASARTKMTAKTNFSNPIEGNNSSSNREKENTLNNENENEDKKFEENYLENSFDKLEKAKLDEIDDLFSPVMDNASERNNNTTNSFFKTTKSKKDFSTSMFKLNENVYTIK